jgi:mRNA interferase RelE/StbE
MKQPVYTAAALKALKRHGNMRDRAMKAISEYTADPLSHATQVKTLNGIAGKRLRIGDYRMIFEETETQIIVTKFAPRGDVYS